VCTLCVSFGALGIVVVLHLSGLLGGFDEFFLDLNTSHRSSSKAPK